MHTKWCIVLFLAGTLAHAASFDCAKAQKPQEKAICASPKLSAADDAMAAAYRAALAEVPAEMKAQVIEGQRAWIRSMGIACPATPYYPSAPDMTMCLENYETGRMEVLKHMVQHDHGVTFVWRSVTLAATAEPPQPDESRDSSAGTLNASWPQAVSKSPEWMAWNKAITESVRQMASAGAAKPDGAWHAEWTEGEEIELNASVSVLSGNLVTSTIHDMWYGYGAAHPNSPSMQFTWLLREQRALKPEDVFRAGSGWADALQAFCDKDLHAKLDENGERDLSFLQPGQMQKTMHTIVTEPANWEIDGKGIAIVWQQYAVACYACTPEPTLIPWSALKAYLNPTFAVPTGD